MTDDLDQPRPPGDEPDEPDEPRVGGDPGDAGRRGRDELDRRYPSTVGGAFYLVVLAVAAVGLGIVTTGSWRAGVRWIAGALIFAGAVRAVLPARDAGMLAVRRRWWDCVLLVGVGVLLVFLASSIPDQPA